MTFWASPLRTMSKLIGIRPQSGLSAAGHAVVGGYLHLHREEFFGIAFRDAVLHLVYFSFLYVICNFISRKMENANTALFRGCLSLPVQKDRHHYDNNEPIF